MKLFLSQRQSTLKNISFQEDCPRSESPSGICFCHVVVTGDGWWEESHVGNGNLFFPIVWGGSGGVTVFPQKFYCAICSWYLACFTLRRKVTLVYPSAIFSFFQVSPDAAPSASAYLVQALLGSFFLLCLVEFKCHSCWEVLLETHNQGSFTSCMFLKYSVW